MMRKMVISLDDSDMAHLMDRLVKIDSKTGLTDELADKAIRMSEK
jgi:hypothetical protein